jgi:membrane protein DedA with SNARE-associated domain
MTSLPASLSLNNVPDGNNFLMNDITQFLTAFGGLAVFAVVFADQAGLPIPAPPWLLAAGALVAGGKLDPALAVGMTALAAVLADSLWFCLGRHNGGRVLHLMSRWSLSRNSSSANAKAVVVRHGLWALAAAKFLPGTVVPSLAGALGMSTRRFLLFDGLAALFYGGCYVTAGFLFHNQVRDVMVWLDRLGHGVVGFGLVLVIGYVACKYALRRRSMDRKGQSSNTPDKKTGLASTSEILPLVRRGDSGLQPASTRRTTIPLPKKPHHPY